MISSLGNIIYFILLFFVFFGGAFGGISPEVVFIKGGREISFGGKMALN